MGPSSETYAKACVSVELVVVIASCKPRGVMTAARAISDTATNRIHTSIIILLATFEDSTVSDRRMEGHKER